MKLFSNNRFYFFNEKTYLFKISFCLLRVYDYSDFIALRLYDSLSTVPPIKPLISVAFWPRFDLDPISACRISYLSLFEGHFSESTVRQVTTSLKWFSLNPRYDESQISKPLFFSLFSSIHFFRRRLKLRNQKQKRNSEPCREIRKRAMSHTHSDPCQNINWKSP